MKVNIIYQEKNKKAFTIIELLFVMIIIGLLASVAILNMKESKNAATITAMQTDLRHTISRIQNAYITNQNYDEIPGTYSDSDLDGLSDQNFCGKPLPISKGDIIEVQSWNCETDSECDHDNCQGYHITVTNNSINKKLIFDSCTKAKPSILDN